MNICNDDFFGNENDENIDFSSLLKQIKKDLFKLMDGESTKKNMCNFNDKIIIKKPEYDKYSLIKYISYELLYKEIPCRSLLLRNIPEGTTKEDIKYLITQFGDFESCNYEDLQNGNITIKFYNILDAMMMRSSTIYIQNRSIMMCFGKDTPVEDKKNPPNNGTIIVFNLPEKALDEDILSYFGCFGEIKGIRRTPNKNTQRFIEFYDTRSARKARNFMKNKKLLISGKKCKINVEFSLPGNYRNNYEKFYCHSIPVIERRINREMC